MQGCSRFSIDRNSGSVWKSNEHRCAEHSWREDLVCGDMLANPRLRAERKEPWSGVNAVFNTRRTSQDSVPNCLSVDILALGSFVPSGRPVEPKSWTSCHSQSCSEFQGKTSPSLTWGFRRIAGLPVSHPRHRGPHLRGLRRDQPFGHEALGGSRDGSASQEEVLGPRARRHFETGRFGLGTLVAVWG